jgi:hypothetical protein
LHRNIKPPLEKRSSKLIDYRAAPNSCPQLAQPDGHDLPGAVDKGISGVTAVIDDIVAGFEDSVREPVDVRDNGDMAGAA